MIVFRNFKILCERFYYFFSYIHFLFKIGDQIETLNNLFHVIIIYSFWFIFWSFDYNHFVKTWFIQFWFIVDLLIVILIWIQFNKLIQHFFVFLFFCLKMISSDFEFDIHFIVFTTLNSFKNKWNQLIIKHLNKMWLKLLKKKNELFWKEIVIDKRKHWFMK